MPVVHAVTITGHRVTHRGVRVPRESASFDCEVYVVLTWIRTFLITIIPLENLSDRVWPTIIYARQADKHIIQVVYRVSKPGI